MPEIAATDLELLGQRAQAWVARCDREGFPRTSFPAFCGSEAMWTASWFEGCYARAILDPTLAFSPVCTEHLVCPDCRANGTTWQ